MTPHNYPLLEKTVLAHRYLYYVQSCSIISDFDYDALEKTARELLPPDSPVQSPGSDLADSYSPSVKLHADYLYRQHYENRPKSS
jgi:NAD-dependent DNA ligase